MSGFGFTPPWKKEFWISAFRPRSLLVFASYFLIFLASFFYSLFWQKRSLFFAFETSTVIVFACSLLVLLGGLSTPRFSTKNHLKHFNYFSTEINEKLKETQEEKPKLTHKFFFQTLSAQVLVVFVSLISSIVVVTLP